MWTADAKEMILFENGKHPVEDETSWKLHLQRKTASHRRRLSHHPPEPGEDTQHAIMIDAGSQGTRLHLYEFEKRVLEHRDEVNYAVQGRKISFPTTNSRWSSRLKPGLDYFAYIVKDNNMKRELIEYLKPLLDFAKQTLSSKEDSWGSYPIYLKATGGLRALPRPYRIRLIEEVRRLFSDQDFNPFFFDTEHARVISGEEEAIYGWTAVNFVKGALVANSEGTGSVLSPNKTYGMMEMGGASAQIAFFEPHGDVMANLFKLQIGAAKHWNVYAHSFLYFGVNGAYARLNARLIAEQKERRELDHLDGYYSPCLPGSSQYIFTSRVHMLNDFTLLPLSSETNSSILEARLYAAVMRNDDEHGNYDRCFQRVYKLFRKEANAWCNFAHDRDCSFAGVYQPPIAVTGADALEFVVTSNFWDIIDFLGIGTTANLLDIRTKSRMICDMTYAQLKDYNNARSVRQWSQDELLQACFRSIFTSIFLTEGVGFPLNYNVTAIDVIDGQKLGWALGSTLYEINTLPWEFGGKMEEKVGLGLPKTDLVANIVDSAVITDGDGVRYLHLNAVAGLFVVMFGLVVSVAAFLNGRWGRRRKISPQVEVSGPSSFDEVRVFSTSQKCRYGSVN